MSKVSVVIPTFNRANFVTQAIDSVLKQTHECEIVVVDHGSTDNTPEIMKNYQDRIKYIRKDTDFGPHYAWFDDFLHTSGDYIHFQYDDDWLKPTFIEKCLQQFDTKTGMAFSGAEIYFSEDEVKVCNFYDWASQSGNYKLKKFEANLMKTMISPAAILYRREIVQDGLYQGNLPLGKHFYKGVGPDYFMTLLALLRFPRIGFVKENLSVFRAHENSITIDAHKNKNSKQKIKAAYDDVKHYYYFLKLLKKYYQVIEFLNIKKRLTNYEH